MFRCRRSLRKFAWALEKARRNSGWPRSSRAASCSRSMASTWTRPRRPCGLARRSCRSPPSSWRGCTADGETRMAKKKNSTAEDFRVKSTDELGDQLGKLKKEQFNLRFQRANGQLENTGRVRAVRKEIARIQTVLSEQRRKAG